MAKKWFQKTYRRQFQDFHIAEWSDVFLSEFDHSKIADIVAASHMATATVFANSHTGLCNYPTRVGKMHERLKGKDALKEMINNFHNRDINVVIYYCTIYTDWYYDNHPDARTVDADGVARKLLIGIGEKANRFSICCLNNKDYRDFIKAQLTEICTGYDFEGVWPDMTWWPTVCYCRSCRERYEKEVGGEIPKVVNWEDPAWVRFHRKRQEWLAEYARMITSTIKRLKPGVTVAHQSGTYAGDWLLAPSLELARHTDWLSADLYRSRGDMSFLSKLFYSVSENRPYEHFNSWCYPGIGEHVVTKEEADMRNIVFYAFSNNGAFGFIDAIDPVGTVNTKNYEKAARIFKDVEKYEKYAGGRYCQDIAIYYSFDSLIDMEENGIRVSDIGYNIESTKRKQAPSAHANAAIGMAEAIVQNHFPYGVVTKKDLKDLYKYQIIILPNLVMLDEEEVNALKRYVSDGGSLYASRDTSIVSIDGHRQDNFMLSELFGVSYLGETDEAVTYVAPEKGWEHLFGDYSAKYPVTLIGKQTKLRLNGDVQVIATITLPYTNPRDVKYASILTNPPGIRTEYPAIVLNRYGKGKVMYTAGALEVWDHPSQRAVLGNLLKLLAQKPFYYQTDAPRSVEITLFDQEESRSYIIHLISIQKDLPNIPVEAIRIKIRMDGRKPEDLTVMPEEKGIDFLYADDCVEFAAPRLETYLMLRLRYR